MIKKSTQHGFTLIEFILTLVIMGIISVTIGRILFHSYQTFLTAQNISEVDWQGFLVLEKLVDDIHAIRSNTSISTAGTNQLVFTDVNGNTVQYQFSGTSILRNSIVLANKAQSFSLSYRDKNGTVTATPSAIAYISVTVTMLQNNLALPFSTTAALRDIS